ncbi:MAG: restriction endonuclease subunit S [Ignavibacteria bacterium]
MSWEKSKIKDFTEVITGGTPSTLNIEYWDNGTIPWLNSGELNEDIVIKSDNYITNLGLKNSSARLMPKETVLIALTGATTGVVGYLTIEACANQSVTGILPSKNHHSKYLYYYLKSIRNKVISDSYGGAQKHISQGYVKELDIPLPPLNVQKQIANILDTAVALKLKNQALLNKYDELAQAIFIDMFGDPVKNEKGWDLITIEKMVKKEKHSIKRGPFGGALKKEIFVESGYLVYEQFHALNNDFSFKRYFINEKKYKELIAFDVKPGDIIISCSGIYLGKLAIIPKYAIPGIINQALLKITLDNRIYNNEFFVKVFTQKNFKDKYFASERGAAIPNFPPMSVFKEFKFIAPPINIQNEYLKLTLNIKTQLDKLNQQIVQSEKLFQTLMKKAFKGELTE